MSPALRGMLAGLLMVAAGWLSLGITFTSDVASLVPASGASAEALTRVRQLGLTEQLLVELNGTHTSAAELRREAAELAARLEATEAFATVRHGVSAGEGIALHRAALSVAPALVPAEQIADRVTEEGIRNTLSGWMTQLSGPASSMTLQRMLADPLDLASLATAQLRRGTSPFAVEVQDGQFVDASGTRALVFAEALPGAEVHAAVQSSLAATEVPAQWFGGPRIARATEQAIKADSRLAAGLGLFLLLGVVALGFGSALPVVGALFPLSLAAACAAAGVAMVSPVHGITLGLAGATMGLAVDYWLHLYVRASSLPLQATFTERYGSATQALAELAPALGLGWLTTAGAFVVLGTSRFPIVADLGAMGAAAMTGAVLGTALLGPVAFALLGGRPAAVRVPAASSRVTWGLVFISFALAVLGVGVRVDGDPRALAPPPAEITHLQTELAERYGGVGSGVLVFVPDTPELSALDGAQAVWSVLADLDDVAITAPTAALPGPAAVAARRRALGDLDQLAARVARIADEVGLDGETLAAATLGSLETAAPTVDTWTGTPLSRLMARHLNPETGEVMLHVVVQHPELTDIVRSLVDRAAPGATVVMPSLIAAEGVQDVASELARLGGLAGLLVFAVVLIRHRDPRRIAAALLPCASAVAWALGCFAAFDIPIDAVSLAGLILTVGLAIDYGVFICETSDEHAQDATGRAIALSSLTSIAAFGALLVTSSPALQHLGGVLVTGLLGAAATALWVSRPLAAGGLALGPGSARWVGRLVFSGLILANIQALLAMRFFVSPPLPAPQRAAGPAPLRDQEGVRVMVLRGSPYEMGRQHGLATVELREQLERSSRRSFAEAVPWSLARYGILQGVMTAAAGLEAHVQPHHLEELQGLVDSSPDPYAWSFPIYTRKLYYHAIHDIGQTLVDSPLVACTGFIATGAATEGGHTLLARNFDFEGGEAFDRDKVVIVRDPQEGLANVSVIFSGMVGAVSGMNEAGIAVAIQAAGSDAQIRLGTPMTLVVAEILERASSLDEVAAVLAERRGMVTDLVIAVDGTTGETAVFEVNPERVARLETGDRTAVANHFRTGEFATDEENQRRMRDQTTKRRGDRMEELLEEHHGELDIPTGIAMLRDRRGVGDTSLPRGHRWAIDADIASHGVVFDATTREFAVSSYPHLAGDWLHYRLGDLLEGELAPTLAAPTNDLPATVRSMRARKLMREAGHMSAADAHPLLLRANALMPNHPEVLAKLGAAEAALGRASARATLGAALEAQPESGADAATIKALMESQ